LKREIHPTFFWLWAFFLVTALIRLDEIRFNVLAIFATVALVYLFGLTSNRAKVFKLALRLAVLAVLIRMLFAIFIGVPMPGNTLFTLPLIQLPDFLVGIRLGGDVTTQRLSTALAEVSLFAALIIAFGAANSLTTPTKILKAIPRRLYGVGVATALATTLTPQLAASVSRVRQAQFLRGQSATGIKSWRRIGTPVLEESLARSLDLAASLEARGYGAYVNPSRYRAIKWDLNHLVALLPLIYLALIFPLLTIPSSLAIFFFALTLLSPLVALR
jgi:energy-coupling factor transporter transmembrane protein EcfT